jgi:hypothetical protein
MGRAMTHADVAVPFAWVRVTPTAWWRFLLFAGTAQLATEGWQSRHDRAHPAAAHQALA